ncbi:MAG: FtsW/RodA/SpoVE family cell cycle protein [Clostridia bacterium]|nr:FtsW/RodA/SpoVE family cell cycle protein [Clostridia bacterium]
MGLFNTKRPIIMIILINILGYALLSFFGHNYDTDMLYVGLAVIGMLCFSYILTSKFGVQDGYIFLIVAMLFSIGEIMLYRIDSFYGHRQLRWLAVSLLCFFVVYFVIMKFNFWSKIGYAYYIFAVALLVATIFLGTTRGGAKNWIFFGNFGFQPSEIAKLLVVFFLADRFNRPEKYRISNIGEGVVTSALVYILIGVMLLQREWGTSILIFLVFISLMYIFGEKKRIIFGNLFLGCVVCILGALIVPHIKVRIDVWLDPWADMTGKGYQITQSLFAIGSGGFFGSGIGLGSPEYIPEVHSDFIFSAICEEFGILGGVAVIMLYFLLVYRGIRISMKVNNIFYRCIAAGVSILFGFQTFIILGGVIKLIPLTGITLPFISYGGSSLLISFAAVAVLEAIANRNETVR